MDRRAVWEETFDTEPLHLKGTKKFAIPHPNKIIHLYIDLDKVMKFGEK